MTGAHEARPHYLTADALSRTARILNVLQEIYEDGTHTAEPAVFAIFDDAGDAFTVTVEFRQELGDGEYVMVIPR